MLDWDDLRTFLAIARHGTLSAAARTLGVHQPTMGRRLAALERRVGAALLLKTPRGYVLTEAGEQVLGNVERIEAEALAVERRITGRDVRLEGVVRLTTVESLATDIVMPVLAAVRRRHPGITVELMTEVRNLNLTRREADIALRMAPLDQADLTVRRISFVGYALYASDAYLETHGSPDFAGGGQGHTIIATLPELLGGAEMAFLTAALPHAATALSTNSRFAHRAAAVAGLGIACLARYLGDPSPLQRLAPPAPAPRRELWMAVHTDIRHMPRIRAVTEALAAGIRSHTPPLDPE